MEVVDRRTFLKILGTSIFGVVIGKSFAFVNNSCRKIKYTVKGGMYPGKIKKISEEEILKEGRWLG